MAVEKTSSDRAAMELPPATLCPPSCELDPAGPALVGRRLDWMASALITLALAVLVFFVVVLPAGVLSAAVIVSRREARHRRQPRCQPTDRSDPASTACCAPDGSRRCERHP